MTKEPIIIDDVDVSECDFYDKDRKYCLTLKMNPTGFKNPSCFSGDFQECIQDSKVCPYTFCDNNPNCYYKQLKRKEQECEKVKKQFRCSSCGTCRGKEDYNNMSRHFDKLRESFDFTFNTLEKVLESEVYLYKTYIDKTFTGNFDWENDKVSIHLEKFIKDSIEHIKFIDETNKILYQEKCELIESNKQYKQALQEIKDYCNKYPQNSIGFKKQILQKCEALE